MQLVNLTLAEFLAVFGVASAVALALYLLDRARRKLTVPTLRFWAPAERPVEVRRRRRIQQPLSLLLQLAGIALLLLAASGLRWGASPFATRDHVLLLDASAWMGARSAQGTLMEEARTLLRRYLRTVPAGDRVMLIRVDALATPATSFESNRQAIEEAIRDTTPGSTALNLDPALGLARRILDAQPRRKGEIVYAGAGRIAAPDSDAAAAPDANLRFLSVGEKAANCGLRKIGLRRSPADPGLWEIFVSARNYGAEPKTVTVVLQFAGAPAGARRLALKPGAEESAAFEYRTRAAGWLEARLLPEDDLAADNRAVLEIPSQRSLKVAVYSDRPQLLRPLLAASAGVEAVFRRPAEYQPKPDARILILDRFRPPAPPQLDALWIEPPPGAAPAAVPRTLHDARIVRWNSDHPLGAGLHAQEARLAAVQVFAPSPGDIRVAETEAGPAILARSGKLKTVLFGFHPVEGSLRYELATPLLFANVLRWMAPETFRRWELAAGSVGAVDIQLDAETEPSAVRVVADNGGPLPFSLRGSSLRFFAGAPGTVRVLAGDRELVYSLSLPELAQTRWEPPRGVLRGLPRRAAVAPAARDLWRWLAILGALVLLADWLLYGAPKPFNRLPATPSGRAAWLLKILMLAAVLAALFDPRLQVFETKTAVAVMADTSASLSPQDLKGASALLNRIEQARGRNWMSVIPFARATRPPDAAEHAGAWSLKYTPGESGRATDLEAAIRDGAAQLPSGLVPRLALVSDGLENRGSVVRWAWQARRLGIPIDTFTLAGRLKPELRLESVSFPAGAFTGEAFPIDLKLVSPRAASAAIDIFADGKLLGSTPAPLERGANEIRAHATVSVAGSIDLAGSIRAGGLGEVRFAQAVNLHRPRALWISLDPPGTETHLLRTLEASEFQVVRSADLGREDWDSFQLVILNNWDLESIPRVRQERLETFVKQGGGLLVIGGERNVYLEKKTEEDALDRTLPAKLAPPRSPEGTCIVLIIDKSSSMEGKKIELARLAAVGVIQNLRPIDMVGVLIFDNSFQWAVPIRRAEDRSLIRRLVSGITPDGGTQIAPALGEAYRRILPVKATFKHIVLLTDGISEEGDSMPLARDAAAHRVTISTVGLGQDVNRSYLEKVALSAGGKAYFLSDPLGLEQILLRDVMEHTGSTAVEKPFRPVVLKKAEILDGVGMETAPELKGYVKFTAKPTADTILSVDRKDPLLARWQYGLGRAAVFTSDAKSRWAQNWVAWKGFDKFWSNLARDLLPHAQAGEAAVTFDSANEELVVDYRLGRHIEEPAKIPDIFVSGPDGFMRPVPVAKLAQGAYRGRVAIGARQGLFRVRPLDESRAFPEIGFSRQEQELAEYGSDEHLLREIAEFTGGRFNPEPRLLFDPGGRFIAAILRLWPGLLGLAIVLNLIELALRKWKGIRATLRGW